MSKVLSKKGDASGRGWIEGYRINFPPMQHPYTDEEIESVVNVMKSGQGQTQGNHLQKFEADFVEFTGANYAFAVSQCTNALKLAALFCVKPGDEVIIPAYTFCATAIPFGDVGAKIVWADIKMDSWTIDPADIEKKITNKTKAIVPVHLLGIPCDMKRIMEIAEKHGIKVVEDCAQALDCRIGGQHVGTFGDFGCFSFHSAKTMTTLGEGGMLAVRSEDDAKKVAGMRHYGSCDYDYARERYWVPAMSNVDMDIPGVWPQNYCIGEAQCALGSEELKSVIKNNNILIEQDRKIRSALETTPEITFPRIPEGDRYVVHQYIMHFDGSAFGKDRNDLLDLMTNKYGIRCIVQYYPLYRYPLFQKLGMGDFDCPVVDKWWDNSFSFPWWCGITDEEIGIMTDSLKEAIAELKS